MIARAAHMKLKARKGDGASASRPFGSDCSTLLHQDNHGICGVEKSPALISPVLLGLSGDVPAHDLEALEADDSQTTLPSISLDVTFNRFLGKGKHVEYATVVLDIASLAIQLGQPLRMLLMVDRERFDFRLQLRLFPRAKLANTTQD